MNFDEKIDRVNTNSAKWDMMENLYGVSPKDGLSMWVADMDFKPPQSVLDMLQAQVDHGVFGYYGDDHQYKAAIKSWMAKRHGWNIDETSILSAHGLVNAVGLALQSFTEKNDGVIIFTPVYHAFSRIIKASGRQVVESPLVIHNDRYEMDLDALETQLTGNEKMVILCSPHNPGGRVWDKKELRELADFCVKHDLILVSDEIHHDMVFKGAKHIVTALAAPDITDRLITLTATTKTFNLAGGLTGNVIISDDKLRDTYSAVQNALGIGLNGFGARLATAAYEGGEEWLDALIEYVDENKTIFDNAINAIPGLKSMPLEATYLAWVDFSGTGMSEAEFTDRVLKNAKIAVNSGPSFGSGGENYLRFNLACPRSMINEAILRMQAAFSDLQ